MMIVAVVISFNPNIDLLEKEYLSVIPQVEHIIYVDNCSQNREEVRAWAEKKGRALFVGLNDNEGIGFAQNVGIRKALEDGASHLIIFDQDTVVSDDFVQCLIQAESSALKTGVNVGLTGPIYRSYDNYQYPVWSIEKEKLVKIPQEDIGDYRQVTHIIASGSLIRKEVFEKAGLMREDWFLGYIDFEFCFRAAQYGFKTIVTQNACMHHQMGDHQVVIFGRKIGLYSPFRRYFDCRNTILIQKEDIFPKVFRRYYLRLIVGKVIVSLVFGPSRLKQIRFCVKGFYDGMRGKTGKFDG